MTCIYQETKNKINQLIDILFKKHNYKDKKALRSWEGHVIQKSLETINRNNYSILTDN